MSTDPPTTESSVSKTSGWFAVLPALVTPICIGLSAYLGLQYLIEHNHITHPTVLRYVNGHPVSQLTVGMFFVGVSSLLMIAMNVFAQFSREGQVFLKDLDDPSVTRSNAGNANVRPQSKTRDNDGPKVGIAKPSSQDQASGGALYPITDADAAIEHGQALVDMSLSIHHHYLWNRLVNSLHYIYRTGSVAGVEDEMKYLADMDIERQQQRYSLSRILIWATPMLGFLGTVLGISQALGGISVGPDNDFQQMMNGLQSSLYVAFDTTALALTLSMVMMFCQFLVDRFEVQLLELVDQKTRGEIARHFDLSAAGNGGDGIGATGLQVLEATRDVVRNQTEIWRSSIQAAQDAWSSTLTQTSDVVRDNLSQALDTNVENLAHYLGESIEKADQSIAHRWEQWQTLLSSNARLMKEHQESLLSQTNKIQTVVETLDDTTAYKTAMQHQHNALEATTKMHDVLARVANEVSSQSKQLQQQGNKQAELLEKSSDAILKSQACFEERISSFSMELPLAIPVAEAPQTERRKTKGRKTEGRKTASKPAADVSFSQSGHSAITPANQNVRRRNPNKPVMFMPSQAVTEMREKTHVAAQAETAQTETAQTETDSLRSASPSSIAAVGGPEPQSVNEKKTISIQDLRQRLGIDSGKATTAQDQSPTLLMPQNQRLRNRVRPAAQDAADRLAPVESHQDLANFARSGSVPSNQVQRKKAA